MSKLLRIYKVATQMYSLLQDIYPVMVDLATEIDESYMPIVDEIENILERVENG